MSPTRGHNGQNTGDPVGEVKKVEGELHFYQTVPSRLLIQVMAGVCSAFGLLLLFSGLGRLGYGGMDEILTIVMGITAVVLAVLFYRFVLGARIILTDEEMRVRDFFRTVRFRYADIAEFASGTRMVRPYRVPGMPNTHRAPLNIGTLRVTRRSGEVRDVTMPGFGRNVDLIAELAERTGQPVEDLVSAD